MKKELIITPAFDRKDKGYGIHCAEMRFYLKGNAGVVQFVLYTGWYLPHNQREFDRPMPADLGYHSLKPMYNGHYPTEKCPFLNGKTCYYDGSGLNAERIFDVLLYKGSDGVWEELKAYYHELFDKE